MPNNLTGSQKKILTLLVEQYRLRHRHDPKRIVVSPEALVILALRRSVAPKWSNIPVICRELESTKNTQGNLGVDVDGDGTALRGIDL